MLSQIKRKIVGQKLSLVVYSEVNHPDDQFYFDGFDAFDHGIHFQMENGYSWSLSWGDEDYFTLKENQFENNTIHSELRTFFWEPLDRWTNLLNETVTDVRIHYIDEDEKIPSLIELKFGNGKSITILIAEELNLDGSIPVPLEYNFGGEIYVFHDKDLLQESIDHSAENGYQ